MALERRFKTLAEAQAVYRAQIAKQRLFVPTSEGIGEGTRTKVTLVIEETGGSLAIDGAVFRQIDAATAVQHSLGETAGIVLQVALHDGNKDQLRDLLTGKLKAAKGRRDGMPADELAELRAELSSFVDESREVNHYQALQIDPAAPSDQIRKSYLKLIRRYHPDNYYKRVDEQTQVLLEMAYQRVTTAFQVLADRKKRDKYDIEIGNFSDRKGGGSAQTKQEIADLSAYRKQNAVGIRRARDLIEAADEDLKGGNRKGARSKLKLAKQFDPRNPLIQRKLDDLD